MSRVREFVYNVVTIGIIILTIIVLGLMLASAVTNHEVETYEFNATLTDKVVIDEYRSTREHLFYWVNGEESGCVEVGEGFYARYAVGDLIPIHATVKEDCFGSLQTVYKLGG